jgi:hypothetical protein
MEGTRDLVRHDRAMVRRETFELTTAVIFPTFTLHLASDLLKHYVRFVFIYLL